MAWIGKKTDSKTGKISWTLQFRKRTKGVDETFSNTFNTKQDAEKFCETWEHIFFFHGKKAIPIDRLAERRKRRFQKNNNNKEG